MLYLMEVLNIKGSYAELKTMLDYLDNKMNKESGGDNYSSYLIQLSKYYMATFRNELAKRCLQDVLSMDRSDSQARLLLGKIFLMQGDPDSALIYAREGLSFVRRKSEKLLLQNQQG